MIWYCHKRGREVRLEKEKSESENAPASDGNQTEEEHADDSALPESPSAPRAQSD